jgi:hypothetical protein
MRQKLKCVRQLSGRRNNSVTSSLIPLLKRPGYGSSREEKLTNWFLPAQANF